VPTVRLVAAVLLLVAVVPACTHTVEAPPEPADAELSVRTSWMLGHRVRESDRIVITGGSMGHYDESTYLSLGQDAYGHDIACYVTMFMPGQGGPETRVGEKVPTTVNGRPGFRNGTGAEGPYLMWRPDGERWTEVSCGEERLIRSVAGAVESRPSSLELPFGLEPLPPGYGLSNVSASDITGSHAVYLGKVVAAFGHADPDVVVSYETGGFRPDPRGRAITVNGRPAVVDEDREGPSVCVAEQERFICVRAYLTDTGPFPDRSGEIPILLAVAEGLRFATDLDDRSTWIESQNALPQ
jgi:hypothetical protein